MPVVQAPPAIANQGAWDPDLRHLHEGLYVAGPPAPRLPRANMFLQQPPPQPRPVPRAAPVPVHLPPWQPQPMAPAAVPPARPPPHLPTEAEALAELWGRTLRLMPHHPGSIVLRRNDLGYLGVGTNTAPKASATREDLQKFFEDDLLRDYPNAHPLFAQHLAELVERRHRERGQHALYGDLDPQASLTPLLALRIVHAVCTLYSLRVRPARADRLGAAPQIVMWSLALTPGLVDSQPGRLKGTALWAPWELLGHLGCVYVKLRGPGMELAASDRPLPVEALNSLSEAAWNVLSARERLQPGSIPYVIRDIELLVSEAAAVRGGKVYDWVESRGGLDRRQGTVCNTYAGQAPGGIISRGFDFPYRQGSMHFVGGRATTANGWPKGGMVRPPPSRRFAPYRRSSFPFLCPCTRTHGVLALEREKYDQRRGRRHGRDVEMRAN